MRSHHKWIVAIFAINERFFYIGGGLERTNKDCTEHCLANFVFP